MDAKERMKRPWLPPFLFTALPNTIFEWLPHLTPADFAVYCCIARKTWGFHKHSDVLAISQIVLMSGIPRRTVERSLASLRQHGMILMDGPPRHPKLISPTTVRFISGDAIQALGKTAGDPSGGVTVTPGRRTTKEKREKSGLRVVKPYR